MTASSCCSEALGIRRGKQRWRALIRAPTPCLATSTRAHLGDAHWSAFVRHGPRQQARRYKGATSRARSICAALFGKRILECVGPVCGGRGWVRVATALPCTIASWLAPTKREHMPTHAEGGDRDGEGGGGSTA